ncbi:hypothetical protein HA48_17115 [Pantoea wallisii]|uniref:Uncharacterized protein n=1 Tax=Pantoea wallisii TaxID=1076551 RepID=A0A1X1D351_9GAMM|nr:hypothetical protein HA48_17115 [Pantoea wallisii]
MADVAGPDTDKFPAMAGAQQREPVRSAVSKQRGKKARQETARQAVRTPPQPQSFRDENGEYGAR